MASLLDDENAKQLGRLRSRLIWRSLMAMLACVCVMFLVALFPRSPQAQPEEQLFNTNQPEGKLRQIVVLHRHGERSTIQRYGYEGSWAFGSIGMGMLTIHGMHQGFDLGQRLRREYGAFITAPFGGMPGMSIRQVPLDRVRVDSTNYDRTVDTVHSLLLGLFSRVGTPAVERPDECERCRPENGTRAAVECIATCLDLVDVPEVPPVTVRNKDPAMQQADYCSGHKEWWNSITTSDAWRELASTTFAEAFAVVKRMVQGDVVRSYTLDGTPDSCRNLTDPFFDATTFMESVWGNLVCYDSSMKRPYWPVGPNHLSNEELFKYLQPVSEFYWHRRFGGDNGTLCGGMLLHEMIAELQGTVDTLSERQEARRMRELLRDDAPTDTARVRIFSAHDTTVYSLLAALNATQNVELPGFTSNVVLELWQTSDAAPRSSGDFKLRVKYNGKLVADALGCGGGSCTFADFVEGTRGVTQDPESCTEPAQPSPSAPEPNCTVSIAAAR